MCKDFDLLPDHVVPFFKLDAGTFHRGQSVTWLTTLVKELHLFAIILLNLEEIQTGELVL